MTTISKKTFFSVLCAGAAAGVAWCGESSIGPDGKVPDEGATITSGEYTFESGMTIGVTENSGPLLITGGKVTVSAGNVLIAGNDNNRQVRGELIVDGTGVFEALTSTVWLPNDRDGFGTLTVKGSGTANIKQISSKFENRTGYLNLLENGSLTLVDESAFGDNETDRFTIRMADSAQLNTGKMIFGNNNGAVVDAQFEGGTIDVATGKEWSVKTGPGSTFVFNGATATIGSLTLEGKAQEDFTNTVEIAGGTVTANGLALRAPAGRNVMLLVSGGTFNLPCKPQICDSDGNGEAVFRMTGGTVVVEKETDLNPKPGSHATLELLGGIYRGRHIRGLTGSPWAGGTGATTVRADGGTLAPSTAYLSGNNTLIYKVPEVRLGEKGLTIDSEGCNPDTCVKFVNDGEGVAGKFVKAGAGTLTVKLTEVESGSGEYAKGRNLNSAHAITVVKGGTLKLSEREECQFGLAVSVEDGATLSLEGKPMKLSVDTLAIGNGQGIGYSTIKIDRGDIIDVAAGLTVNRGAVDTGTLTEEGKYPVFTCRFDIDSADFEDLVLVNPPIGKDYGWIAERNEETGVTTCSVVIAPQGTLTSTMTYVNGVGTMTGAGPVSLITGTGTVTDNLKLARDLAVIVAADEEMVLAAALKSDETVLTKAGSGRLEITGDNADFAGSFKADGGTLAIAGKSALGPVKDFAKQLTLSSGTLAFASGDTEGVSPLKLVISTPANKAPAILDVGEEATLTATDVEHVQGALIKKGAGELALDLGAGQFTLLKNNGNENSGNAVVLPANGDSPSDTGPLSALTVLEGTLSVTGAGVGQTTVMSKDPMLIGANYVGSAPAVLKLEDVTFGSDGKHVTFGRKNQAGAYGSKLLMRNARFNSNKLEVGYDGTDDAQTFTFDLDNSYLYDNYKIQFCWGKAVASITAKNSTIECSGNNGVIFGGLAGATFTGPSASLAATSADGTGGAGTVKVYNQDNCTGTLKFEQGARLVVTRGILVEKMEKGVIPFVFDNGIFEIRVSNKENGCRSKMAQPDKQGFTVEQGGLAVQVAQGVNHYITFPIRGEGPVTKTGAGTLYLTESTNDKDVASNEKLLQNTGLTTVAEGTLVLDGTLVAEGAKLAVAADATLDLNGSTLAALVSGAGTITNGKLTDDLTLVYGDEMPTFGEGVLGSKLTVDFTGTTAEFKTPYVVGHYTGAAPMGLRVKAVNTGLENVRAVTTCEGGDIKVTLVKSGIIVLIN